jgi:hypothetical protein
MQCGKTTLLTLLERLCPRSLQTANITAAAVYRTVDAVRPTLLIDEADTFMNEKDELRGILNSGHARAGACVIRLDGDKYDPKKFSTWCAVVIARIGKLAPTLADRSIPVELKRKASDESVERLRLDRLDHLGKLASMAARWAADNLARLAGADPEVPDSLGDRAQDNWRPLIAIAEEAGGEWPDKARMAALALSGGQQIDDEVKTQILADLMQIFDDQQADKLASKTICDALAEMEERPWPEWKNGRPITATQLGRLLKPFGISPGTIRLEGKTAKGYKRADFEDTFARWLPSRSVTPSQVSNLLGFEPKPKRHTEANVTAQNPPEPSIYKGCDGVTAQNGGCGEEGGPCVQCGRPVLPGDGPIRANDGWLHEDCYDGFFGFQGEA